MKTPIHHTTKRDWLDVAHKLNSKTLKIMNQLKIGDVVYLKSDRTVKMTVANVDGGEIQCIYFNKLEQRIVITMAMPEEVVTLSQNPEDNLYR